jgi:hypothetical protein
MSSLKRGELQTTQIFSMNHIGRETEVSNGFDKQQNHRAERKGANIKGLKQASRGNCLDRLNEKAEA